MFKGGSTRERRLSFPVVMTILLAVCALVFTGCRLDSNANQNEIRVDSEPTGAFLSVNGKELGRTPQVLKQPALGKYLLQFSKDGYDPVERVLMVTPDVPRDCVVSLTRVVGLVLFQTTPSGAEVSVDGAFRGKAPFLVTDLPSGSHRVSFVLEGYDPREMELNITDRTPQLCAMNMRSIYATLQVESTPSGAAVIVDGIHKGKTPCAVEEILVGTHTVKVLREGYKDSQTEIKIEKPGNFPVSIQLEERLAALDVISTPQDAKVSVNDEFKGRTPIQISGLRDGKYTVVVEKTGFEKITQVVEIRQTQDAKVDVAMQKATGTISMNIVPQGAGVHVDGELKGVSAEGPFVLELPPGTYKVDVSKAGHRPQAFKLTVEIRKTAGRDVMLQRIWVKDIVVVLKDGRVREGMLIAKYPNGVIRIEPVPGVFEEYAADEVVSATPPSKDGK